MFESAKRLAGFGLLAAWLGAVAVCSIQPLMHCHTAIEHNGPEAEHVHAGEEHHHPAEHAIPEHSGKHTDEPVPDSPCDDNLSCVAINSAHLQLKKDALSPPPSCLLAAFLSAESAWRSIAQPVKGSFLPIEERVLLLKHEVCTRSALFSLAPPFA